MKQIVKFTIAAFFCFLLAIPAEAAKTKKVKLTGSIREPVTMKVGMSGRTEVITSLPYVFEVPKNEFPVLLSFNSPNFLYFDITVPKKAFDDTGHVYILKVDESAMAMNQNRTIQQSSGSQQPMKSIQEQARETMAELTVLHQIYYYDTNTGIVPMPLAVSMEEDNNGVSLFTGLLKRKGSVLCYAGSSSAAQMPRGERSFFVRAKCDDVLKSIVLTTLAVKEGNRFLKIGRKDKVKFEYQINFSYEKIADELYKITVPQLAAGEYVFCQHFQNKLIGVFDFSIDPYSQLQPNNVPEQDVFAYFNIGSENDSAPLLASNASAQQAPAAATSPAKKTEDAKRDSDIDINVPVSGIKAENTFALVIANENYSRVEDVPYALNDGRAVKEYLQKTFGLSEKAIIYLENATLNDIKFSINRVTEICNAYGNDASLIVYYSGHGIPEESTGDGYLLPVDGYGTDTSTALSLNEFYGTLSKLPTKRVSLFMDACFSGTRRDGSMLVAARGVAIKTKAEKPQGNIIAFSAAQGDQTAYPLAEKKHGLMTYFLLKKIQQTKGQTTMGELFNYVQDNVKKISIVENGKLQVPSAGVSPALASVWEEFTLK